MSGYNLKNQLTKAATFLSLITACISANAQPVNPPPPYGTIPINYIRTWDATAPESDGNILITKPLKDVKQTTQYIDGLSRVLQTVVKQGSLETGSSPVDMVDPVWYDNLGREKYKFLAFAANTTGGYPTNDGTFKNNPFQQQSVFMQAQYSSQGENFFYGETLFEESPLNRPRLTMPAGFWWVGHNRGIQSKYFNNTLTDDVKKWNVANVTNDWGTYSVASSPSYYSAEELSKSIMIDENQKQVIQFTDKEGKVILKKVQLTAQDDDGSGSGYPGWLCTYYIYDDLNNLRCVVQPKGIELLIANGWVMNTTILNEQCFRYEYDLRNRMIRKKIPGTGTATISGDVYMVYDTRDRLVMTQDANLRVNNKWMVTKYDELNRPVESGLWVSTTSFLTHLTNASSSSDYPVTSSGYEELTKTFFDNYDWRSQYGNPLSASYNNSYDTYFQAASNINWPYAQANAQSNQLKGIPTGTRLKVLGTSTYLFTVDFYDHKARLIQTQSQNITGGTDIITTQYTWAGQPLIVVHKHEKSGTNAQTSVVITQITYDDLGRITKTEKKLSNTLVNGGAMSSYKTISQNEYDKLGQLKKKILSPTGGAGGVPIENLNYEYNIRGWLLGANRNYIYDITNTIPPSWFGFDLAYDKNGILGTTVVPQYNGNIAGTIWKSKGDGQTRKYDFTYDGANRLTSADFNQHLPGSGPGPNTVFDKSAGIDFSVNNLSFDANGNISTMDQKAWKVAGSTTIDQLSYAYINNGNKLAKVTDAMNDPDTKLGDFHDGNNGTNDDYSYDANGNLITDQNKKILNISYNHLNLPQVITVEAPSNWPNGSRTITYTYDAAGNKLKKEVFEGMGLNANRTIISLYIGGNVYESKITNAGGSPEPDDYTDRLQFIPHEEGRIRYKPVEGASPASFQYDYMLKDHLGNVRMVLTEEQKTDAYPPASLEDANLATEQTFYGGLTNGRVNKNTVPGYPNDTYTNPNDFIQQLSGNDPKIGSNMVLKVMAGDKFNLRVSSWYMSNGANPEPPASPLTDLVNALLNGIGSITGTTHGTTITELENSGILPIGATQFLDIRDRVYYTDRPKAFVNWIFFDEQFKYSGGGFEQVGTDEEFKIHLFNDLAINKSGYLYVYVSNETPNIDVFFDNLQVTHIRGQLLEETHYYPFGLTMSGISSKALNFGNPENKRKFNKGSELQNKEFSDGSGLELYATNFRSLDPQLGRWWQIDPKPNHAQSLYSAMNNNPILYNDPLGDTSRYTVQRGDNLSKIAKQNNTSLDRLLQSNPQISNPNIIQVGQSINIPGAQNPNLIDGTFLAVVNSPTGAKKYGHNALMVGNDKTGWTFISKEGRQGGNSEGFNNNVLSGGPALTPLITKFGTMQDLLESISVKGYKRAAVFSIESNQTKPIIEKMIYEANSKYSVLSNNCGHACGKILESIGLYPGYNSSLMPSNTYGIPTKPITLDYSPIPNVHFQQIILKNNDKLIITIGNE